MSGRNLILHAFAETPEVLTGALRIARHAVAGLDGDVHVQIVVQGGAVHGLTASASSPLVADIAATAADPCIQITACQNSMRRVGIDPDALLPVVDTVPAAVPYIAERQWDGWAYVRV